MIEDIVLEFTDEPELVMETDQPFDLRGDTVSKETVLAGILFHMPNGVPEYGICTYDADTSDGTAQPGDIAPGKIAYSKGSKIVGTYHPTISMEFNKSESNSAMRSTSYTAGNVLMSLSFPVSSQVTNRYVDADWNPSLSVTRSKTGSIDHLTIDQSLVTYEYEYDETDTNRIVHVNVKYGANISKANYTRITSTLSYTTKVYVLAN